MRKPRLDEPEDDSLPYIIGTGSFDSFTATFQDEEPKVKRQIGFIRKDDISKPSTRKSTPKGERKAKKGAPKKGAAGKRASR